MQGFLLQCFHTVKAQSNEVLVVFVAVCSFISTHNDPMPLASLYSIYIRTL